MNNCYRLLVILAAFSVLTSCSMDPQDLVRRAEARMAKGDNVGAILDLKTAIQQRPDDGAYRLMLGSLYNKRFDGVSAEKELLKAQQLGVIEGGRVPLELATAYLNQRKYVEILRDINVAAAYEAEIRASIHGMRGLAHLARGDLKASENEQIAASQISAANVDAKILRAHLEVASGKASDAIATLNAAIKQHPTRADAKLMLASLLRSTEKPEEAKRLYSEVLQSVPEHYQALVARSTLLATEGKFGEADKDVAALLRYYKAFPQAYIQKAFVELLKGSPRQALDSSLIALKAVPEPPQALLMAGIAHKALGEFVQAEAFLSRFLRQRPNDIMGRRAFADLLIRRNQPARAVEVLRPIIEANIPDSYSYVLAGQAYAFLRQFTQAQQLYQRAVELAPEDSRLKAESALVKMDAGQVTTGTSELERALEHTNSATPLNEVLVLTLLQRGEVEKAEKAAVGLEKRAPNSPLTWNLRGLVSMSKREWKDAARYFEQSLRLDPAFYPAALNLAQLDILEGRVDAALKRYDLILNADKTNLPILLAKGQLLSRTGKMNEAVITLLEALRIQPRSIDARERLILAYRQQGDEKRALEVAEQAATIDPESPAALALAGTAQLKAGKVAQSIQTILRLVRTNPDLLSARLLLAQAQISGGEKAAAEATLKKAAEKWPKSFDAQTALVTFLAGEKRSAEALSFARSIRVTQPQQINGFVLQGDLLEREGRYEEALSMYQAGMKVSEEVVLAVRIFRVQERLGKESEALNDLRQWVRKRPNDRIASRLLAHSYASRGDYQSSIRIYENLLTLNSADTDAMNGLAWAYYKVGDARALKTAEAAHALSPKFAYGADTLGWILVQNKQVSRGLELLQQAHRALPDVPTVTYHYAAALQMSGNQDRAHRLVSELMAKNPDFPEKKEAHDLLSSLAKK